MNENEDKESYYNNVLASNVIYYLDRLHYSKAYLGTISGVSANTIINITSGKGTRVSTVGKLAEALGCGSGDLVDNWRDL